MADELDELVSFLGSSLPNLRYGAVDIVEGLTGSEEGSAKLLTRAAALFPGLLRLLQQDEVVAKPAVRSLVNLSQDAEAAEKLVEAGAVLDCIELLWKPDRLQLHPLLLMLLVNLTNLELGARELLRDDKLRGVNVSRLVRLLSNTSDGEDAYDHVASILVNLTRLDTGRELLLQHSCGLLKMVLHHSASKSLIRRRGVMGTLKNCCFEAQEQLQKLLALSDLVWPCLLLPVAGKQIYPESETSRMPRELAVPLSMERHWEDDPQVRAEALEAIYMLVSQEEAGMKSFWGLNGAMILKRGYEYEEDAVVMDKFEQLGALMIAESGSAT